VMDGCRVRDLHGPDDGAGHRANRQHIDEGGLFPGAARESRGRAAAHDPTKGVGGNIVACGARAGQDHRPQIAVEESEAIDLAIVFQHVRDDGGQLGRLPFAQRPFDGDPGGRGDRYRVALVLRQQLRALHACPNESVDADHQNRRDQEDENQPKPESHDVAQRIPRPRTGGYGASSISFCTRSTTFDSRNGFSMYSTAPRRNDSSATCGPPKAVTRMTGVEGKRR